MPEKASRCKRKNKIRENSKDKISILAPFDNRIIIDFKSNSFKYSIFSNFRAMCRCQPFLNKPITEERAIKLQQEIDSWQHHHRVSELNLKVVLLPSNITTLKYYSLGPCDESKWTCWFPNQGPIKICKILPIFVEK